MLGFGVTLYQVLTYGISSSAEPSYTIIQYVLMFAVSIGLAIILISLLFRSYYAVNGEYFITSFGIIKSKYKISDILSIELDRKTDKLTVYFKGEIKNGVETENPFVVIVVNPEWNEKFVDAILEIKPEIEFSIKSETPNDVNEK